MNSRWHLYLSFFKSGIRIVGCIFSIVFNQWILLAIGLGVAEILGILEEIKDER